MAKTRYSIVYVNESDGMVKMPRKEFEALIDNLWETAKDSVNKRSLGNCDSCKYADHLSDDHPCVICRRNYADRWEATPCDHSS